MAKYLPASRVFIIRHCTSMGFGCGVYRGRHAKTTSSPVNSRYSWMSCGLWDEALFDV